MMVKIKQKLKRLIKLSLLTLVIYGCNQQENYNSNNLECILNYYLDNEATFRKKEFISINYKKDWSDSTSIVVISRKEKSNTFQFNGYKSTFKGVDIYLNNVKENTNIIIPNNLNWEKINIKSDSEDFTFNSNDDFDNLQVIYNRQKSCIQNIILAKTIIKSLILENCKICK